MRLCYKWETGFLIRQGNVLKYDWKSVNDNKLNKLDCRICTFTQLSV